ncbi:hypothetical protein NY551_18680 [Curtobacterium flaccumfaciens pv. oortii]|uniref:hypothetical protein n=1 Tax=Curtobacterium flaccumfaciens TaxID=2035 RepID=UPI00265A6B68|nr:hypothetical protein [Curtobacterium flaccumfaciens]MCS5524765.1 hypothetical protein [Curtobacterium flaccumfaciens pv. oortii]
MTTVRGVLRSTETVTADGHADDQAAARARAVASLDLSRYELVQASTLSSTASGDITIRAVARSTSTQPHEATGRDYATAIDAYRASIPEGWISLHVTVEG